MIRHAQQDFQRISPRGRRKHRLAQPNRGDDNSGIGIAQRLSRDGVIQPAHSFKRPQRMQACERRRAGFGQLIQGGDGFLVGPLDEHALGGVANPAIGMSKEFDPFHGLRTEAERSS